MIWFVYGTAGLTIFASGSPGWMQDFPSYSARYRPPLHNRPSYSRPAGICRTDRRRGCLRCPDPADHHRQPERNSGNRSLRLIVGHKPPYPLRNKQACSHRNRTAGLRRRSGPCGRPGPVPGDRPAVLRVPDAGGAGLCPDLCSGRGPPAIGQVSRPLRGDGPGE